MLQRFDVDETQNEDGAFGQFGNEEGGPSTVSSMASLINAKDSQLSNVSDLDMSAYAIAGPTSQSTAASNRQVPSIPSKVPRQDPGTPGIPMSSFGGLLPLRQFRTSYKLRINVSQDTENITQRNINLEG